MLTTVRRKMLLLFLLAAVFIGQVAASPVLADGVCGPSCPTGP